MLHEDQLMQRSLNIPGEWTMAKEVWQYYTGTYLTTALLQLTNGFTACTSKSDTTYTI